MSTTAKKQKNREYYLKNREKILSRARERNGSRRSDHLEIVPKLRTEDVQSDSSSGSASGSARTYEETHQVPSALQEQPSGNTAPVIVQDIVADRALALFDVQYEISPCCFDNPFTFSGKGVQIEQTLRLVDGMPLKRKEPDSEKADEIPSITKEGRIFNKIPLSFMLRLLLVVCLTLLMTAMQVEFYREHDILPEYAVPLALASEVAFLSLVSMNFRRSLDWLRIIIHLIFLGYFLSALSFHVYAKSRSKAASGALASVPEITESEDQLKQAERSLDVATKGRAWKSMEIFGAEVSRLRKLSGATPRAQVLGTTSDEAFLMEAVLLILLRALLLAASALNALRLRDQIREMKIFPG
ncbi:MAG TPA: hypothetical protein VFO10_02060 [Oligoflexus sp.]|uniref:hypothetical protein n=1 Tax=Oligoflexus sp. TaxID=1971216 RepID=UPI002D8034E7|nr:hypothetical protein [Oligoflexus sp.]HET9236003.1 hypothetical protein [Oligoflexus sp.]